MKNKLILNFVFVLFIAGANLFAQSDFQIVQSFKDKTVQIEKAIAGADSLGDLNIVNDNINQLSADFESHKELLDKSLYPDNFDRSLSKLRNSLELRKGDFAHIDVLNIRVTGLQDQVDTLTRHNNELASQFDVLESQSKKDRARLGELERMVAQLRTSLQKRDQIVMDMVDNLLPASYQKGGEMSPQEKQEVYNQAQKNNVLNHIRYAINDNIRFLEDTQLNPDDLTKVKEQQKKFMDVWKTAGPTMIQIYSEKGKSTGEVTNIDASFTNWNNKINQEAWQSITEEFAQHNIILQKFSNGDGFTTSVTSYIDDQMSKADAIENKEAEATYKNFVDSTWDKSIKPSWIPFLKDNKLISNAQNDTIDVKIASWGNKVYPHGFNWFYIIIGILVVAVIILLFTRRSPKVIQAPREKPV